MKCRDNRILVAGIFDRLQFFVTFRSVVGIGFAEGGGAQGLMLPGEYPSEGRGKLGNCESAFDHPPPPRPPLTFGPRAGQ